MKISEDKNQIKNSMYIPWFLSSGLYGRYVFFRNRSGISGVMERERDTKFGVWAGHRVAIIYTSLCLPLRLALRVLVVATPTSTISVYYKGVRQFYHTRYHSTKIKIVNKLRTISRKLEVFLGEENMLEVGVRYRLKGESIRHRKKLPPPPQITPSGPKYLQHFR